MSNTIPQCAKCGSKEDLVILCTQHYSESEGKEIQEFRDHEDSLMREPIDHEEEQKFKKDIGEIA